MRSPILFLVFNRPNPTRQVFEAIRAAKPPKLYVAADGPRPNREGEQERCEEVRRIATAIDWDCEIKTLFRDKNLGCKIGVSSGIDWFFENEQQGIILEDDCLPAKSFFLFCDEMLDRYKDDTRVWQISGSTFFPQGISSTNADYFFSRYGPIWGWASWRRAWKHYDADLTQWRAMSEPYIMNNVYPNKYERIAKLNLGSKLNEGQIDTWDFQWGFIKNYNNALSIIPKFNQILNIGFNTEATHTTKIDNNAPKEYKEYCCGIKHPNFIYEDLLYGAYFAKVVYYKSINLKKIIRKIISILYR